MSADVTFEPAGAGDAGRLLPLQRALYASEHLPWAETPNGNAFRRLLADPSVGRVLTILCGGELAGYAALTWGYSTEFGGRFVLLDELFVDVPFRRRGLARGLLAHVEEVAIQEGFGALRLEVSPHNAPALGIYRGVGYEDSGRLYLTRLLPAGRPG